MKNKDDCPVVFEKEGHKYVLKETGELLLSGTSFISLFHDKFDPTGSITEKYAKKVKKTVEEVKEMWRAENKKSTDYGTAVHNTLEDFINTGEITNEEYAWVIKEFKKVPIYGTLVSEKMVYNEELLLCGTVDLFDVYKNKKGVLCARILDFKGLALDTPIPTKDGFKSMNDISVGDSIFDGNGKLTTVQHTSEIHYNDCYKLTFDTNDTIVADHEHKWEVFQKHKNKYWVKKEMTTQEIFNTPKFSPKHTDFKIKCEAIDLPDIELPLDPYILGLWLADGNRTCGTITCINDKIWQEVEKRGFKTSINHNIKEKKAESRTVFGLRTQLRKLNLLNNKHMPVIYSRSSFSQRLDFLRGFMDGDGHFNKKRKRCVMITTKKWQADCIFDIASSLGMKPTIIPAKTSGFGKTNINTWHVCFTPKINPFLVRNQDYLNEVKNKNFETSAYKYIKKIEKVATVPTKCLSVTSETHTYLAGKGYTKTHNTNKKLERYSYFGNKMNYCCSHLDDVNFNHYTLQLSFYAYLAELKGLQIDELVILYINPKTFKMEQHPVVYEKKLIMQMIDYYLNNLK